MWIKFCGCTSWEDVAIAIETGADAFGMIFAPSPRRITWRTAGEIASRISGSIEPVAVFTNPSAIEVQGVKTLFPRARMQFSGGESAAFVARFGEFAIKTMPIDAQTEHTGLQRDCARYPRATILFDTRHDGLAGGTGTPFAWDRVTSIVSQRRAVIAGGLTPDNVATCIRRLRPFGVDARSGIETNGCKDRKKMLAFVRAAREANEA
jgi:phosphoribosylanthranilate isomerase